MVTAYIDKDYWANRRRGVDWEDYSKAFPTATDLEDALEDATVIINDSEHIACLATNITNSSYLDRIKRLCYDVATRILMVEQKMGKEGGRFMFSLQDYMFMRERNFCLNVGIALGYRYVMKVET